ncbi:helix-turn-helix transcriptional regulator [Lachnospiraceae bacterium MD329]|nr:helix-turn-helix transcriptional regulator [Lachnospiraceae bacterium MD329]
MFLFLCSLYRKEVLNLCVVANRIISLLKDNNLKQTALADMLGVSKQKITDWKSGKSKSYFENIPQIANFLGVSCEYLLTGTENRTIEKMSKEEEELLSEYKKLDFRGRSAVMQAVLAEQDRMENEKNTSGNAKIG